MPDLEKRAPLIILNTKSIIFNTKSIILNTLADLPSVRRDTRGL